MKTLLERYKNVPWEDLQNIEDDVLEFLDDIQVLVAADGCEFAFYGDSCMGFSSEGFVGVLSYDTDGPFWGSYKMEFGVEILGQPAIDVAESIVKDWEGNKKKETLAHEENKRKVEEENEKRKLSYLLDKYGIPEGWSPKE